MNSRKSHRQSSIHLDLSNQREFVASFSVQHRQNASAAFTLKSMRGGGGATYVVRYEYDGPRVRRDGNVVTLGGYGGERGEKLSYIRCIGATCCCNSFLKDKFCNMLCKGP